MTCRRAVRLWDDKDVPRLSDQQWRDIRRWLREQGHGRDADILDAAIAPAPDLDPGKEPGDA